MLVKARIDVSALASARTRTKRQFWKEKTFWSDGYFCCTVGNASQGTIRLSIESQG
ncbi:transposase [Ktedonobacter sp. SOSP1-85]|uniref:transposase n=1 Tax=Ktedonobacter sp. SOSP1-85 TaxID=2778367 RepID=UPI001915476B